MRRVQRLNPATAQGQGELFTTWRHHGFVTNLRAAGAAASRRHAKARWATLRIHLIAVPARIASSARRLVLRLPTNWPWAPDWDDLWATATPT